jgi:tRNA A-37 threonylcarbamoyl transferase component Bud32
MFQTPSTIGRYKVLGELGRGSMGIVYLAEDPALKREVAIKLVHQSTISQEEVLVRFQQEAEISARLNHPNVIMVFDVGEEAGFGPFMAMEFADGDVLSDVLTRGPMTAEDSARILIQGFHALQAAHAKGIIHRDFKPENLILTRNGRLKLMDFGIARQESPTYTSSGVLCTPSFAAPELLDAKLPSPATDNWAFCVTACLMITGSLPFKTGSISSLLYAIAHEPPVFPENVTLAVQAVFTKALQKKPEDRYPDLHHFMLELLDAIPLDPEVKARCLTFLETSEAAAEGTAKPLLRPQGTDSWVWLHAPGIWWTAGTMAALIFLGLWLWHFTFRRRLTLTSYPSGVKVFLDDKPLGTTPLLDMLVSPQAGILRLEKDGYQRLERSLRPEDRMLTLVLTPNPLVLSIHSNPEGAEIFVDNALVGLTPFPALSVAGERSHRLQVRKAGYETWNGNLSPGEKPPETILLRKLEVPKKSLWKRFFGKH